MNTLEVKTLLENGQNASVAFASERSAKLALAETLSALANSGGGTLLLGATQAGSVRGVRAIDALCDKTLSAALLTTPPLVLPVPEPVPVGDRTLVAVHVPHGLPHAYSVDGRYLVRDGSRNHSLESAEIHQLFLQRGIIRLETEAPDHGSLEDLDWDQVRQYTNKLEQLGQAAPEDVLRRRGCLAVRDGQSRPTFAGLLLFGPRPSLWIPNASITAVRYSGTEMSDQFVREEIGGSLPDQIRKAESFLRSNTPQRVDLEGLIREEHPTYPDKVLREVIVNAVAHRDYTIHGESIRVLVFSDRIHVYSPGRLPGHVTVENIVDERFSRNPVVVQVLADMGFIERLGYGVDRMLRLMAQAGLPAPRFEETSAGFQVTLYGDTRPAAARRSRWTQLDLNPRQESAVRYVIEHERITNREYQKLCSDVSPETIRRDLSDLVHRDILLRIGRKRATYYILKDASLASL